MSVVLILLVASLCLALAFLGAFIWSVRNGQYDDDYTPSVRVLFEDRQPKNESTEKTNIRQTTNGTTESSNH